MTLSRLASAVWSALLTPVILLYIAGVFVWDAGCMLWRELRQRWLAWRYR